MSAEVERAACAQCDEQISIKASECPECGNNPARKIKRSGLVLLGVGLFFIWFPIVGLPLAGIGVLVLLGYWRGDFSPVEDSY